MVKVSITLPNNAQITFESEEPEVIHEIVGMVLRDLPRDLMQAVAQSNGNGVHQSAKPDNGTSSVLAQVVTDLEVPTGQTPQSASPSAEPSPKPPPAKQATTDEVNRFIEFCRSNDPVGDMRRVVVAAEGAARFLGAASVDAQQLGRLFDLVGWPRPHSFVQSMRNAARSKFRWLQRVPGRSGHYTVTDLGRTTAIGR